MKKSLLFIVAALFAGMSFSQKTKIKDNIAYIDEVAYCKWNTRSLSNEVSISGMSSTTEEIFVMWLDYSDPALVSKSNP